MEFGVSAATYLTCYLCVGFFALFITHLIQVRLKEKHSEVYRSLGSPTLLDSNLTAESWRFAKFIWWRHFSEVNDKSLHVLCVLATVSGVAVVGLFFFQWSVTR
jgi:hypothetical protein